MALAYAASVSSQWIAARTTTICLSKHFPSPVIFLSKKLRTGRALAAFSPSSAHAFQRGLSFTSGIFGLCAMLANRAPRASLHENEEELVLCEENVHIVLEDVKVKLGSIFGNSKENLEVGITGDVELASLDGPMVTLRLKGRFWHKRSDVLARVSSYIVQRIPEVCDVSIEDATQLEDSEEASSPHM